MLTSIRSYAFNDCTSLKSVNNIPKNFKINDLVFYGIKKIPNIVYNDKELSQSEEDIKELSQSEEDIKELSQSEEDSKDDLPPAFDDDDFIRIPQPT